MYWQKKSENRSDFLTDSIQLEPSQNKKGQKILGAPKTVSFSQLPAVKKDTIFGAARKNFGPSYFVSALVS